MEKAVQSRTNSNSFLDASINSNSYSSAFAAFGTTNSKTSTVVVSYKTLLGYLLLITMEGLHQQQQQRKPR